MNCHEARGRFAELVGGELGLTEWATVEAHVGPCAECAQALDQLYRTAPGGHRRRLAAFAPVSARPRHRRLQRLTRQATVTAVLVLVMGLSILAVHRRYDVWLSGLRSVPSLSDLGSSGTDSRNQAAPQEPPLAAPGPASSIERERQDVAPSSPAAPASLAKSQPAPEAESRAKASGATKAGPAKRALPAPATKPEPAAAVASPTVASSTDVVIQLSVQDQRVAERHVKTLIARLGGTRRGRERAATMILVVPRANYGELTRGLAQIGSWQMESDAGPLPDPVHVAVRLAK